MLYSRFLWVLFALYQALAKRHLATGLVLWECEIGASCLSAYHAFGIEELGIDNHDVASLLTQTGTRCQFASVGIERLAVARFHLGCHARCLQLTGQHSGAYLVEDQCLYAPVQRVEPPLIVARRLPMADHLVAFLIKTEVQPKRIVRRTPNAVIPLYIHPGIDDFVRYHTIDNVYLLCVFCDFLPLSFVLQKNK